MNQMVVNAETGFLESPNASLTAFDSEKKLAFLKLAEDFLKEHKKWPDLGSLCDAVGIDPRTLDNHMKADDAFADAFKRVTLQGKWRLESKMFDSAEKNPMLMFGWLRRHFPAEYNPETKIIHSTDNSSVKRLEDIAKGAIEGEIVVDKPKLLG